MSDGDEAPPAEEGAPAWMATFGDMMSLLLTFFILILSFANMDVIKFSAAVGSLKDAFGTKTTDPGEMESFASSLIRLSENQSSQVVSVIDLPKRLRIAEADLQRRIQLMIATHDLEKLVETEQTSRGVVVRVRGQLLFEPGSARLLPEAYVLLREIAELVRDAQNDVSIGGHTDDEPIATKEFPSNWHLSAARAIATLEYMVDVEEVDPRRLSAAGYAEMKPLVPNDSPAHRDENRRVEFLFERPEFALAQPEEPPAADAGRAAPPAGAPVLEPRPPAGAS